MKGVKAAYTTLKTTSRAARFQRYTNLRKLLNKNIMRYGADSARGAKAVRAKDALRQIGSRETRPTATRLDRMLGGDKDVVSASKFSKQMRAEFGGNDDVRKAADAMDKAARNFQWNYRAATGVDLGDKLGEKAGGDAYGNAKDVLTCEVGSRW
jgi:hypothetical protein